MAPKTNTGGGRLYGCIFFIKKIDLRKKINYDFR